MSILKIYVCLVLLVTSTAASSPEIREVVVTATGDLYDYRKLYDLLAGPNNVSDVMCRNVEYDCKGRRFCTPTKSMCCDTYKADCPSSISGPYDKHPILSNNLCRTTEFDCKDNKIPCKSSVEICCEELTDDANCVTQLKSGCELPQHPANGKYSVVGVDANPGDTFDTIVLNITCDVGYAPDITSGVFCVAGQWYSDIPKCVQSCRLNKHPSIEYRCGVLDDKQILQALKECDTYVPNGTIATPECRKPNYYHSGFFQNMHCYDGSWNYMPICLPECGTITPRAEELIAGGRQAMRGEIPWHVAVYDKKKTPYDQICGGSIVSNTVVITAAHCVWESGVRSASDFAVAAGKLYRAWDHPKDLEAQKSDVTRIIVPTYYRGATTNQQDDIALMIVQPPFVYRTFVRPVCLNFDINFDLRQLVDGNKGKVAGWGLVSENGGESPTLKTVDLPFVKIEECIRRSPASFHGYLTSDKICAGFSNGTALCKGDSGGGLAFPEYSQGAERYYLRGIVSTAPTNDHLCNTNTLTAFTRVIKHERFIKKLNDL